MKAQKIIFFFIVVTSSLKAQVIKEWGAGIAPVVNYTVPSYGGDLRAFLVFNERVSLVPQLQYYPSFNRFHDFYAGTSLHFNFTPSAIWGIYALGHASYHNWINYSLSNNSKAKPHNWNAEPGIGIMRNYGCLRPFIETRYNINWKEGNLRVGLAFFFGDCFGGHAVCPAYTLKNKTHEIFNRL